MVHAIKAVKQQDLPLCLIGQHPTARPEACLSESDVDYVVIGEPENTVSELVDALASGKQDFRSIDGLGFNENGKAILTGKRAFIEDLDSLPFPARHLLPMEVYNEAVKENPLQGRNKQALDHRHYHPRVPIQLRLLLSLHPLGKNLASSKPKKRRRRTRTRSKNLRRKTGRFLRRKHDAGQKAHGGDL